MTRVIRVGRAATVLEVARGAKPTRAKPRHLEHDAQVAFFKRVDNDPRTRDLLVYAVPNAGGYSGGYKSNAARASRMKAEGVRRGPPDINIDEPREDWHGMRIEMKIGKNRQTPEQAEWAHRLDARGYYVITCYSAADAWSFLMRYLGFTP